MGIRVTDNFNRANVNPIAGVWSTPTGGGGGGQISGNLLLGGTTPGDNFIQYNNDTPPADHYCKIKFISTENSGGDADDGGPCVRFTSGGNGYLFNVQSNNPLNDTTWDIFSLVAGVGTSIASGTLGVALVSGDIVECRAVGTTISGWINGVQKGSVVDTLYQSGGGYGVHMFEGGAANGKWDDFEGGDFATTDQIWAYYPDESEDLSGDVESWDFKFSDPRPADATNVMSAYLVYDSSNEQEWSRLDLNDDESYGFELWLTPADTVMSAYLVYDSTLEQEQPDDEAFGYEFWVTPFDADQTLQGILYDSSQEQEQPDDESFGFTNNPLLSEVDYILVEDGSLGQEVEEEIQDFIDTFVVNNVVIQVDFIQVEDGSWMQEDDEAIIEFLDNFVVNNPDFVPGAGSVIVFYDGLNVASGLNYHKGLSRPVVVLVPVGDGTYTVTKVADIEDERVGLLKETVTIDGGIP